MILKIKPSQAERVNTLVRNFCYNCINGNCLLLDDGEEHSCVQLLCVSGIYCNYFKRAVLPSDKKLYTEIIRNTQKDI